MPITLAAPIPLQRTKGPANFWFAPCTIIRRILSPIFSFFHTLIILPILCYIPIQRPVQESKSTESFRKVEHKMKKSLFFLTTIFTFLVSSCFSPWQGEGNLELSLGGGGRSRSLVDKSAGSQELAALSYKLVFSGPGGTFTRSLGEGTTRAVYKLANGKWRISVRAYADRDATPYAAYPNIFPPGQMLRGVGETEVEVTSSGASVVIELTSATEVENWVQLEEAASGTYLLQPSNQGREEIIFIKKSFEINPTGSAAAVGIGRNITLTADTPVILSAVDGFLESGCFDISSGCRLTLGKPGMTGTITIDGKRDVFDRPQLTRTGFVYIDGGEFVLNKGVTLKNRYCISNYGAVFCDNDGIFIMNGGEISGNEIFGAQSNDFATVNIAKGTFIMNGGSIHDNKLSDENSDPATVAIAGSAVKVTAGTFKMYGGEIYGNTSGHVGAVSLVGNSNPTSPGNLVEFTMYGGAIYNNTVQTNLDNAAFGGGVYIHNAIFTMKGGKIFGNKVRNTNSNSATGGNGGGVYVNYSNEASIICSGIFYFEGGEISGNEAYHAGASPTSTIDGGCGGGVYVKGVSVFNQTGGRISGNTASLGGNDIWPDTGVTYTATFHANGGTGTPPAAITWHPGQTVTMPAANGLTRVGYTFAGWSTAADGTGSLYNGNELYNLGIGDKTFYANWQP
jgi:uncharacterized repeat protein (TIGR02543 family)